MKTILFTVLAFFISASVFAGKYESAMQSNISEMYKSHTPEKLETIGGKFFRIAEAEGSKWLPYYYAAYSYVSITFNMEDGDKIDAWLDKAQEMLDKAMGLEPDESELYVLQGLLHSMRITTPMRGMKYSSLSNQALGQAEKLNPENPRLWFCKAQNVYHTPSMFGGGADKAQPLFEKAARLFDSFEAPEPLWPAWGEGSNAEMLEKIMEDQ
ncbi:tetratricopeptide repeat protein [Marinilabilia sp.]